MFHYIVGRVVTELDALKIDLKALSGLLDLVRGAGETEETGSKSLQICGDTDERCPLWIHVNKYGPDSGAEPAQAIDRLGDAVQRGWTGSLTRCVTEIY